MKDSHYIAMLLGIAVFSGLLLAAKGNWSAAAMLGIGAGAFAAILREQIADERAGS